VNKPFIRAIEVILKQPGITFGKCAALCGGPDWPISVLCGLIRANLLQVLIGTAPILGFVAPCVLTGAFYLREEEVFETLSSLMFVIATICNVFFLTSAVYSVQEVLDAHHALLHMPLPKFRDLDWIDWCGGKMAAAGALITQWGKQGTGLKTCAVAGSFMMTFVTWIFLLFDTYCFGSFTIRSEKEDVTMDKVIKPLGWFGLFVFTLSCILFTIFFVVLNNMSKHAVKEVATTLPEKRESWEQKLEKVITSLE